MGRAGSLIRAVLFGAIATGGCFTASAQGATSCNPQSGVTTIGLEWTARQCIAEGSNDNTSLYYINNMVECSGSTVTLYAPYGDTQASPASIINYWKNQGYRVLRNKEGTHIVAVHRYYTGLIDGKDMDAYATYNVHTDVLKEALIAPAPTPDCKGWDFNRSCKRELPAESTVTMGVGRLSHSRELFSTGGAQPLSLAVSLSYRSLPFAPSAIGAGWSHGYEATLQAGAGYGMVFWNQGVRRVYARYSSTGPFVSPKGDWSTLVKNADNTYTITEKDGLKWNFDTTGAATSLVDRNGNTLTFTYTSGKLTGVSDPGGRTALFTYDGDGKLATVTDPKGNVYTFTYSSGRLASVLHPDGGLWLYTYGSSGLLATKTDPEGNTVTYGYDGNNRLASALDPAGRNRSYAYPAQSGSTGKIPDPYPAAVLPQKQTVLTEKDGGGWTYLYDTLTESVRSETDPLGNTTSYTRDSQGNMLTKSEPGVGTTTYTYDGAGNILSVTDPLGQTTNYTRNGFGQVLTITGAPGNTTNTYDTQGNLLSTTDPAGAVTGYGYDAKGNLTSITDPRGKVTTLAYDAADNLISVTDPVGAVTGYTRDVNGNMLTTTDAAGKVTTFTYDTRNRLISVTDPLNHATAYTYDKNGNPGTVSDANGAVTESTYNYQGRLTGIRDALNSVTAFAYGSAGCPSCGGGDQLTSVTDARSRTTSRTYDTRGRLLSETDPLGKATSYAYGPRRDPVSRTDANSATTSFTYDALGRLTQKSYPDSTSETYSYDSRNNILTATNGNISYTYSYDGGNRVTSVTDTRGYTIGYQYDQNGNRTRMQLQPGTAEERTITYSYDDASRPATMTSAAGPFSFGHDGLGRRTSLAYPNAITAAYIYDNAGRLTSLSHGAVASFSYTHDAVGNRTSRTAEETEQYFYDPVYRLLEVVSSRPEFFIYDAVGNRLEGPGDKDTAYLYNEVNQLLEGRTLTYGYDNNGNQAARIVPGAAGKTWTQTWDYENRLTKVEKIKGAERKTVTFSYDPFGRRIEKKLETVIDGITKTVTTTYVYDNEDIVQEEESDGTAAVKTRYVHGPGIDEPLAMERNGSYYYYHADGLGSVTAITDAARNVVQRYEYDSFGMVTPETDFASRYTYTGREWDKETGLYYYRARYYDPVEGRFISKDPIGFAGGDVNLYGYVQSNPVNLTDAEGLSAGVMTLPLELTCQFAKINPVTLGLGLATYPSSTSTCADYPQPIECEKDNGDKWMCEGNAKYDIKGTPKHVVMGPWVVAYGRTAADASYNWIKACQSSAPPNTSARHVKPKCKKIR